MGGKNNSVCTAYLGAFALAIPSDWDTVPSLSFYFSDTSSRRPTLTSLLK